MTDEIEVRADDIFSRQWFRNLIYVALFGSIGTGTLTLTQTDDRFRAADFREQIEYRDNAIAANTRYRLEHDRHATRYTEKIDSLERLINKTPPSEVNGAIRELRRRVHELEVEIARLERKHDK